MAYGVMSIPMPLFSIRFWESQTILTVTYFISMFIFEEFITEFKKNLVIYDFFFCLYFKIILKLLIFKMLVNFVERYKND